MGEFGASYLELDTIWPWKRVLHFYDRFIDRRFERALPTYDLIALHVNINRGKGTKTVRGIDVMPQVFVPLSMRSQAGKDRTTMKWSKEVVAAFSLALSLRVASNSLLAGLGNSNLKASGWKG